MNSTVVPVRRLHERLERVAARTAARRAGRRADGRRCVSRRPMKLGVTNETLRESPGSPRRRGSSRPVHEREHLRPEQREHREVAVVLAAGDARARSCQQDVVPLEAVGRRRERVRHVAAGLPRHQVLAVGVRRPEQRRVPVVAHDEPASEPLVHREVFGLEVAEREDVVAAPGRQETAVTLGPAAVPAVRWVRVAARPPRVGIGVQHAPVRVDRRAAGPGEASGTSSRSPRSSTP